MGQWEEDGLVYAYTKRTDFGTYECFVGGMLSNNRIFIKEAGEHCQRHVDPYRHGMELNKIGKFDFDQSVILLLKTHSFE